MIAEQSNASVFYTFITTDDSRLSKQIKDWQTLTDVAALVSRKLVIDYTQAEITQETVDDIRLGAIYMGALDNIARKNDTDFSGKTEILKRLEEAALMGALIATIISDNDLSMDLGIADNDNVEHVGSVVDCAGMIRDLSVMRQQCKPEEAMHALVATLSKVVGSLLHPHVLDDIDTGFAAPKEAKASRDYIAESRAATAVRKSAP